MEIDITKAKLGMTRAEMYEIFGSPTDIGKGSRKYRDPPAYRYGRIEFGFGPRKNDGLDYVMDTGENGQEHNFLLKNN